MTNDRFRILTDLASSVRIQSGKKDAERWTISCKHLQYNLVHQIVCPSSDCQRSSMMVHSTSQSHTASLCKIKHSSAGMSWAVARLQKITMRLTLCGTSSSGTPSFRASSRVCTSQYFQLSTVIRHRFWKELFSNNVLSKYSRYRVLGSVRGTLRNKDAT